MRSRRKVVPLLFVLFVTLFKPAFSSGQGIGIEPQVEVAENGTVKVTWAAQNQCVGAKVSFGIEFEDDPIGLPQYRLQVSAVGKRSPKPDLVRQTASAESAAESAERLTPISRFVYTAEASLKDIEKAIGGTPFNGSIFYRATCFDPKTKSWLDSGDCVFRYVKPADFYSRAVAIVEGPIVANITSGSVLVRWVTDMPSRGVVHLGEKSVPSPGQRTEHEVIVDGLQPSTTYSYRIELRTARPISAGPEGSASVTPPTDDILRTRPYRFRTAPLRGLDEPFSFAVFCDTRANDSAPISTHALNGVNADVLRRISLGVLMTKASFALIPGDLISGITDDVHKAGLQLRSWKKAVAPAAHSVPFYTGMGNHDAEIYDEQTIEGKKVRVRKKGADLAEEIFRREMTNPTNGPQLPENSNDPTYSENVYSFDYGNSHFVMLNDDYKVVASPFPSTMEGGSQDDREKGKIVGRQLEWLRRDLESASKRGQDNIFVFFHEAAFPNGGHVDDSMYHKGDKGYVEPRSEFWRVLCQHRVVAVFCGHEHNYSRTLIDEKVDRGFSFRIWQIITGGGGAPFHPQERTPWSESVKAFSARQHYCIVAVAGQKVRIRVHDLSGNVVDDAELR